MSESINRPTAVLMAFTRGLKAGRASQQPWHVIETAPKDCTTVLTQHIDDLYPAVAFCVLDSDGSECWMREMEGPEDTFDGRPGKCEPLYRRPTHWMPLPWGPK